MAIDLKAPEVQDAIRAAVEEATAGLKAKRDELLGEVRTLKKGREIDPGEHAKLEEQVEDLRAKLTTAESKVKTLDTDLVKERKARTDAETASTQLQIDNGLSDALAKAGVTNPVHAKAAKSMLQGQVQLVDDAGKKLAKVGDKPLADFITEWAKGDEGKFFVSAPANSGGGAGGSNNGSPNTPGKMGGTPAERTAAIAAMFPDLKAT